MPAPTTMPTVLAASPQGPTARTRPASRLFSIMNTTVAPSRRPAQGPDCSAGRARLRHIVSHGPAHPHAVRRGASPDVHGVGAADARQLLRLRLDRADRRPAVAPARLH